jgi:hypothetical protein
MNAHRTLALGTLLLCAGLAGAVQGAADGFVRVAPEQIHWQDVPNSFGVQVATIAGDPKSTGLYIQRVRFPPYVMDRPHWHPNDRYVTVLKGEWFAGTGPHFDPKQAVPMKPGGYMLHPAKALHWDGSNSAQEVIVQICGMGPADTVLADPKLPMWVRVSP